MNFDYSGKLDSDGFFFQEADVHAWCKAMGIIKYRYAYSDIQKAMSLSAFDVNLVDLGGKLELLSQLPVRFERVNCRLWLQDNQLTSLVGLPQSCKTIAIYDNPLSFQALMPLSQVAEMERLYLPITLKHYFEDKGIECRQEPRYLIIEKEAISKFQSLLKKIEQQQHNEKALQQNRDSLLALNQSFQQKNLFKVKGQRHDV